MDGLGTISYQWKANGSDISGATSSSYTLTQAEVGKTITITASYTDGQGKTEAVTSVSTASVDVEATGTLGATGTAAEGGTLAASLSNLADADGTTTTAWQWQISNDGSTGWTDLANATSASYAIATDQSQVGQYLRVIATTTDALGGTTTFTASASAQTINANDAPTGSVTISGTATQGQTLTAANTLADVDGLSTISYQWLADGAEINGATGSTYSLGQADVGKTLSVTASYIDAQGTAEAVSGAAITAVANVNDVPTGTVTISGTATQGQTLTASNTLADADGLGTIGYQWKANGTAISGATSATYTLGQAEVGKTVSVTASYIDPQGTDEAVTSSATTAVANVNDMPIGTVTISGTATQGQTLTAANTLADADGLGSISYQWLADGLEISGATDSTFTLTQEQVGKALSVMASYTDDQGSVEAVTSSTTAAVANIDDVATGKLVVTGAVQEGASLTATLSDVVDIDGTTTTSYQWQTSLGDSSNWTDVSGATAAAFDIASDQSQVGQYLRLVATTVDALGGGTVFTGVATRISNVNDAPTGSVSIGGTATQGQTLTASNTLTDLDGMGTVSYQWLANGNAISGATASGYTLNASDVGQAVSVRASYTDGGGTTERVTSTTTAAVSALPGVVFGNAGLGQLVTTEAAGTDSFTVALRAVPRENVTLTFTISDATEAVFAASGKATHSVTFTAANWAKAQTVVLRGVDDKPEDGDVAYTISTSVSSSDLRYDGMRSGSGLSIANLSAQTTDNDAPDEQYGDQGGIATADLIQGGNGASDLYGLLGRDVLYGNNGDDRLYGGYGDDVLWGNADDDELEGDQGNDKLDGGIGNDTLNGGTGNDSLYGQAGSDNLLGEAGKDLLLGGDGNDTLNGGADADNMDGGNGADVYYIDNMADVVRDSGTDTALDTVYIMAYLGGGITLGAGIDNGVLNDLAGKGSLTGNTGNNALTGNASDNTLDGGAGNDSLNGGVGADSLVGGAGNDSLSGGLGDDILYSGEGDDLVDAGDGADLIVGGDGAGNDQYNGGAGIDTVKYTSATAAITVNLGTGAASGINIGQDKLSNIENLIGGKGSDSLTGSAVANKMDGDTGDDAIKGEAGNDTLIGGVGNDTLDGGTGADSLEGGDGGDTYVVDNISDKVVETNAIVSTGGTDLVLSSLAAYTLGANVENGRIVAAGNANLAGNALNNLLYAGAGNNVVNGAAGIDTLSYLYATAAVTLDLTKTTAQATGGSGSDTISNVENLTGSNFNDKLTGSSLANVLNGGAGNDMLTGAAGNDTLIGGAGNDTLNGGAGKDSLTGGAGNDVFDFNALGELGLGASARDVITDFTVGQDKIDLSTIDANTALAGDQAFKFVTSFTATAGQVRYSQGIVYLNTDSDTAAEYEIGLTGVVPASLMAASFVL